MILKMGIIHFLNVNNGDCSIIEHNTGRISLIDVCNARKEEKIIERMESVAGSGNLNQKAHPVNPIQYLRNHNINSIFRFVLTHPDMDHMDGIKDLVEEFKPANFYDTDNKAEKDFSRSTIYREDDWKFYKNLRDSNPQTDPKRLTLFSGDDNIYRTKNEDDTRPGDAFYILSPTKDLVEEANRCDDYNDCSYVILYEGKGGKVLFSGDAHNKTWEHILENHESKVSEIDLLIAPHHGRKSSRDYSFLDTLKPKLSFFGNAESKNLAYDAWNYRGLPYITNNQAGCMVVDANKPNMPVYVTNQKFANQRTTYTWYSDIYKGWYLQDIK